MRDPRQFVHEVEIVEKIPFYGYHPHPIKVLRIALYEPGMVKKAAELLESGAILGVAMQPYEAHLTHFLRFYRDANIQGMD